MRENLNWKRVVELLLSFSGSLLSTYYHTEIRKMIDALLSQALGVSDARAGQWGAIVLLAVFLLSSILLIFDSVYGWARRHLRRFDAGVVGGKRFLIIGNKTFRPGEYMRFRARFNGSLNSGFFTARIEAPEDLPDVTKGDRTKTWWPCYDSMIRERNPNTGEYVDKAGRLKGIGLHEHQWPWKIPPDYPLGQYRACIGLYEWSPRRLIAEKIEPFIVTRS